MENAIYLELKNIYNNLLIQLEEYSANDSIMNEEKNRLINKINRIERTLKEISKEINRED